MTSQTSTQTVQSTDFSLGHGPAPLCVNEWRAPLVSRFACSEATAAQQGETHRKYAVTDRSGVRPCAGEQEEEELQVRQQEDRHPHPDGERRQAGTHALVPGEGWRGRAGPASLHMLQTDGVHLKDVVHRPDAEEEVESHAHPSHPLTEVHHPPYCREKQEVINTRRTGSKQEVHQDHNITYIMFICRHVDSSNLFIFVPPVI